MSAKKASSRGAPPGIQFSTPVGAPETKRKMLLYKRLLSRELLRDERTPQQIRSARRRREQQEAEGVFPTS
ncbi:uncharacterized protein LOC117584038 [Drosophila guanche]|uniref:uncharacterized protein LOC117584038 n=1 Tax=Drosophila guanche TaxID=7266 RepID=UPI001470E8AE|nr:uncharacterized protein LOC117584038 [Drosophila guanche]